MSGTDALKTLADLLKLGTTVALSLFVFVAYVLLTNADSVSEASDTVGRTIYTMIFILVPTSAEGVFLSIIGGFILATISIEALNLKLIGTIIAFSFGWTAINIIVNWHTAPI